MVRVGELRYETVPGPIVALSPVVRFVEATGGDVAALRIDRLPVSSASLWCRSPRPAPDDLPLRLHFDLKAELGFDHAVIVGHRTRVRRATRVGDLIGGHQVVRSVGPLTATGLGPGRTWEVDHVLTEGDGEPIQVETFTALGYVPRPTRQRVRSSNVRSSGVVGTPWVSGPAGSAPDWTDRSIARAAAAARVWAPVHHDPEVARRVGLPGVVTATQHVVALVEWGARTVIPPGIAIDGIDLRMQRSLTSGPSPTVSASRPDRSGMIRVSVCQRGVVACEATVRAGGGDASMTLCAESSASWRGLGSAQPQGRSGRRSSGTAR